MKRFLVGGLMVVGLAAGLVAADKPEPLITEENQACVECHRKNSPALVMEWERSRHAQIGTGCRECHGSIIKEAGITRAGAPGMAPA